jgi:hypothetical protein
MTFENHTGEHLFIGDLQVPSTATASNTHTDASDGQSDMAVDRENPIHLGGVQVDITAAPITAVEKPKDVALTNLTDCTINLVHTLPLGAIHIKNLKRCVLVIPPVSGSILLHDCEGCTLIGACHQVHTICICLPLTNIVLCCSLYVWHSHLFIYSCQKKTIQT